MRDVKVAARVRPFSQRETSTRSKCIIVVDQECTTVVNPNTGDAKAFVLDHSYNSFDPGKQSFASNESVFKDMVSPLVDNLASGNNGVFFVYGQPGTGKSYSLVGEEFDPGVIPQALEMAFDRVNGLKQENEDENVFLLCRCVEINQDMIRDVFASTPSLTSLKVRADRGYGAFVEGVNKIRLQSLEDCEQTLTQLLATISSIGTQSHLLFTLDMVWLPKQQANGKARQPSKISKLHFVRLATMPAETAASAQIAKSSTVDRSVLAWSNCMSQLAQASSSKRAVHVPFRDSPLTRLLQDSMEGENTQTGVLAVLSPAHTAYKDTINSFRMLVRCKESPSVVPDGAKLKEFVPDSEFIPAAGGGWRWSYCTRTLQIQREPI